jgi:NAD(P)-dependent dehydrogenase (short-subunit alcohol dehydrogenase family)
MRGLEGKVALVAGAAPGNIGAATAIRLAQEGTSVVAADLNEAAARAVADVIQALGGNSIARSFDITDEASYKELVDVTVKEFGRLDGLFNVAADLSPATLSQDTDVLSASIDVWRHTIDVTLSGYMYGIRHAPPIMIDQGGGAIVNTMSTTVDG